jgi:hypothetical protein
MHSIWSLNGCDTELTGQGQGMGARGGWHGAARQWKPPVTGGGGAVMVKGARTRKTPPGSCPVVRRGRGRGGDGGRWVGQ